MHGCCVLLQAHDHIIQQHDGPVLVPLKTPDDELSPLKLNVLDPNCPRFADDVFPICRSPLELE